MSNDLIEQLDNLSFAELKKKAATYRIAITKDMDHEQILALVKAKVSSGKYALEAMGDAPKPGYARIRVFNDPSPTASNKPVYVSVNGYAVLIPREIETDVPVKIVEALGNAKSSRLIEDQTQPVGSVGRFRFKEVQNYPFAVITVTPGPDPRGTYERAAAQKERPREAYREKFGYYPTEDELKEALRSGDLTIERVRPAADKDLT
jgi:hypothetical protein